MKDFYMTLPSNSSMRIHEDNTAATFKTHLPKHIFLDDAYEVALMEIHYPCTLHNMTTERHFIRILDEKTRNVSLFHIPDGTYSSIDFLISYLNSTILNGELVFKFEIVQKKFVSFQSMTDETKHFMYRINFSPVLALQLGFHPDMDFMGEAKAQTPYNLMLGVPRALYVYTDFVEPQLVGDVMARLLRVVRIDLRSYNHGGQSCETFTVPHYVPVSRQDLQQVEVNINDDTGHIAPFLAGTSTLVLHFRKQS